jgi:hypothetical protein
MRHLGRAALLLFTLAFVPPVAAGKPPSRDVDVNPTRLTFDATPPGATVTKSVTVTNVSTSPVSFGTCSLSGDGDFTVTFDTCSNQALAPNQASHVDVSFTPQSRGRKSATLTIPFGSGSVTVSVTGRTS